MHILNSVIVKNAYFLTVFLNSASLNLPMGPIFFVILSFLKLLKVVNLADFLAFNLILKKIFLSVSFNLSILLFNLFNFYNLISFQLSLLY